MKKHVEKTFVDQQITLDGQAYERCTFRRCQLGYAGGPPPSMVGCHFENCNWGFMGAAANTVAFMAALYSGGMRDLIEKTIESIRDGKLRVVEE